MIQIDKYFIFVIIKDGDVINGYEYDNILKIICFGI